VGRRAKFVAGAVIVAFIICRAAQPRQDARSQHRPARPNEDELVTESDDTFAFEAAARYNEGIVANVDAIDTSLTTVLAGDVALLVLLIDKIKELAAGEAATAAVLMGLSTSVCVIAYAVGFSVRATKRDGARPRALIPDLMRRPDEAMTTAIVDLIRAGEDNLAVRFAKKSLALLAIVLLFAGAVLVALARLNGAMVY
jgi:hypothetical protein